MSHIQSQVLGAPLICGGRLEGAMVKWMFKNLDWCWWKRCTCTYSGPPVWPPWSQVADRTHCRRGMCKLHPEGCFYIWSSSSFQGFELVLVNIAVFFVSVKMWTLTICLVTLLMVRTPPSLSRALSSPSLFHWTVGWGLPLSTLQLIVMRRPMIMKINEATMDSNPLLFVDKQFFGFLFREADFGL